MRNQAFYDTYEHAWIGMRGMRMTLPRCLIYRSLTEHHSYLVQLTLGNLHTFTLKN